MALHFIEEKDFENKVEKYSGPKMLAFYAAWCPHCHRMMPVFEEAAKEYDGKVEIFAVDVDKAPQAAAKFAVRGIPTMLFFQSGARNFKQLAGEQDLATLKEQLDVLK